MLYTSLAIFSRLILSLETLVCPSLDFQAFGDVLRAVLAQILADFHRNHKAKNYL